MELPQGAQNEEVVEAEVVPEDGNDERYGRELTVQEERGNVTLFGTNDPAEVIVRAARAATALKDVLVKQKLTTRIGSNDHVQVEGWGTLGSMLGVFAVKDGEVQEIPWPAVVPKKLLVQQEEGKTFGYTASYRAQTLSGEVVGGGEADCKRTESKWMARDDHALKSMAQTRAQSKALKAPLSFIVSMAGYESTPAEEMDTVTFSGYESPFGPPMNPHDTEKLVRAMTFLINDAQSTMAVKHRIEEDSGGYFPRIAFRALVHVAKAARDGIEQKQNPPEEEQDGESAERKQQPEPESV